MPPRPRAPRQRLAIQPAGAIAHRPGQPAAWGRRSARACFASGSSRAGSGTAVFLRACRPWVLCQRLSASGLTQHLRHVQAGSPSGQPRHCCRNRSSRASSRVSSRASSSHKSVGGRSSGWCSARGGPGAAPALDLPGARRSRHGCLALMADPKMIWLPTHGTHKLQFRGLLRGVLLARPKVTTQGCRRVARSAAGLVRANPPTGHHLPSRPSPSAICDLPPAGCCSASHQLAHLRIPWSNSWWQGMPRQHNQMQPQRQPPAGPSAHSPVQFLVPRPAGPHNQRQPRRPPACSPDRTN